MEPLSNIDAIYKKFPFLEKHASRSDVKKANVERWVTESVNNYYPSGYRRGTDIHFSKCPDCCDAAMRERLHLLSRDGETLYVVGENRHENIGQALHRLGTQRKFICYGLRRVYYRRYKGLIFKREYWKAVPEVITIIKLPKGIANCEEWVESIANHSLKEI